MFTFEDLLEKMTRMDVDDIPRHLLPITLGAAVELQARLLLRINTVVIPPGVKVPTRRGVLHEAQAAEALGLSPRTLQAWRIRGRGPRFSKLGKRVVYLEKDLLAFIERGRPQK